MKFNPFKKNLINSERKKEAEINILEGQLNNINRLMMDIKQRVGKDAYKYAIEIYRIDTELEKIGISDIQKYLEDFEKKIAEQKNLDERIGELKNNNKNLDKDESHLDGSAREILILKLEKEKEKLDEAVDKGVLNYKKAIVLIQRHNLVDTHLEKSIRMGEDKDNLIRNVEENYKIYKSLQDRIKELKGVSDIEKINKIENDIPDCERRILLLRSDLDNGTLNKEDAEKRMKSIESSLIRLKTGMEDVMKRMQEEKSKTNEAYKKAKIDTLRKKINDNIKIF